MVEPKGKVAFCQVTTARSAHQGEAAAAHRFGLLHTAKWEADEVRQSQRVPLPSTALSPLQPLQAFQAISPTKVPSQKKIKI